eukprot:TRINITY_DN113785_c0_g1_i1.p1 TRINITY_DN113785_c0_g1~~TRINITY_DN113785_c0_g1_i1.p1  ORF type:complete len:451 (-),score=24.51 TRINITY_DN113785_c0_g1_i1:68-1375(-)
MKSLAKQAMMLLQPPGACTAFTRSGSRYPPLGLYQLAATTKHRGDVSVLDADGWDMDDDATLAEIKTREPAAIGLTVTSRTCDLVEKWAAKAKALPFPVTVVIGGPHAAFSPNDVFAQCPSVDAVVKGEGEPVFPEIVEVVSTTPDPTEVLGKLADLPGVMARGIPRDNDKAILRVDDFTNLPFPLIDETTPIHRYWAPDAVHTPLIGFMTQRGCPFKCGFCSSPALQGREVRGWSVPQVLDELEHLVTNFGIKEVTFFDDVFTVKPSRLRELCTGMIERKLGLSWYCNARADQVSVKLASLMREAGCHQVFLGFESGDDRILKTINKGATVVQLERGAAILKEAGINRSVGFVVGLPGESDESIERTIALFHRVKPERHQFTRWTPLAGSPLVDAGFHPLPRTKAKGFHDRETADQVGLWLKQCYAQCPGKPSV